jgi:four helix bundle protein
VESVDRRHTEKLKAEIWKAEMNQGRLPVEFRERTKGYASATIRLFVKLPKGRDEIRVLGKQFLRAGTSVAAHVREASRARSNEEFVSKLGGALQEADESQMWLELLRQDCGIASADTLPMEKEADELIAVMTTMINRTRGKG